MNDTSKWPKWHEPDEIIQTAQEHGFIVDPLARPGDNLDMACRYIDILTGCDWPRTALLSIDEPLVGSKINRK